MRTTNCKTVVCFGEQKGWICENEKSTLKGFQILMRNGDEMRWEWMVMG